MLIPNPRPMPTHPHPPLQEPRASGAVDAISRGDAQWQRIEGAVEWPKGVTAADLFELAAQV